MIGNFRYISQPGPDCVAITMFWQDGTRQGVLKVPIELERQILEDDMPSPDDAISIDGALAYGLMLSIRADLPLWLSGDISVWRPEWGQVIHNH